MKAEFSVNNYVMDSTGLDYVNFTMQHYSIQFELLVDDLAEWGPESIMVLNNYISVPSESAQRAATKLITR